MRAKWLVALVVASLAALASFDEVAGSAQVEGRGHQPAHVPQFALCDLACRGAGQAHERPGASWRS